MIDKWHKFLRGQALSLESDKKQISGKIQQMKFDSCQMKSELTSSLGKHNYY